MTSFFLCFSINLSYIHCFCLHLLKELATDCRWLSLLIFTILIGFFFASLLFSPRFLFFCYIFTATFEKSIENNLKNVYCNMHIYKFFLTLYGCVMVWHIYAKQVVKDKKKIMKFHKIKATTKYVFLKILFIIWRRWKISF